MDYLTAEDSNDADKFTDFANSYMKRQNRPLFVRHEQTKIEAEAFAKSFSLFASQGFLSITGCGSMDSGPDASHRPGMTTLEIPNHQLRRLARKRYLEIRPRQNNTTGKSAKTCQASLEKIFRLTRRANQGHDSARLTR
jgi:hypothetical protein